MVHVSTVSTSERPEEDLREAMEALLTVPPGWLRTAAPQVQVASEGSGTSPPPDAEPSPQTSSETSTAAAPSQEVSALLLLLMRDAYCKSA